MKIDNSKQNLVLLTRENHIKVHHLAALCAKDNKLKNKMLCAVCLLEHRSENFDLSGSNHPMFGVKKSKSSKEKISKAKADWWKNHENTWQDKCALARKGKKRGKYRLSYNTWVLDKNGKRVYK